MITRRMTTKASNDKQLCNEQEVRGKKSKKSIIITFDAHILQSHQQNGIHKMRSVEMASFPGKLGCKHRLMSFSSSVADPGFPR